MAEEDLGAPYSERGRERHRQLCAALRDHADIEIQLKDFFGEDCANPLCFAEVGEQRSLLVVDCCYSFDGVARPEMPMAENGGREEPSSVRAGRLTTGAIKMSIAPDSIQFHVFEQIDPTVRAV